MTIDDTYGPGDLDRMIFAVAEADDISTQGVIRYSKLPVGRAAAALAELRRRGRVTSSKGHHHGDGDLCQCRIGEAQSLPRLVHWYTAERGDA